MSKLITAAEVAKRLGLKSKATIHRWRRRGLIPGYKAGDRTILYDFFEVVEAMKAKGDLTFNSSESEEGNE